MTSYSLIVTKTSFIQTMRFAWIFQKKNLVKIQLEFQEIDYVSHLSRYMTNLNIVQESSRQDKEFDYFSNLQKSVHNPGFQLENWETMCIMADFG